MANPVGSHGTLIAIEKDGDPAGTFTNVAKITNGDFWPELQRSVGVSMPHNDTVTSKVVGPMNLGPFSIEGDFLYSEGTHDDSTGLQKRYADGDLFGFLIKGPNWSSGVDEFIGSGYVTAFNRQSENDAGIYSFTCTIEPSGKFKIDGTEHGVVA